MQRWAQVLGSVWGHHLGLAGTSKCELQACCWFWGHPFKVLTQQNVLSAIAQKNTFAATAYLQLGWAQWGAKPAPS